MKKLTLLTLLLVGLSLQANMTPEAKQAMDKTFKMAKEIGDKQREIDFKQRVQDTKNLELSIVCSIFNTEGKPYKLELDMVATFHPDVIIEIIKSKKFLFSDAAINQLSSRSMEELMTVGGKAMLKEEIVEKFNTLITKEPILFNVYFTKFVITQF